MPGAEHVRSLLSFDRTDLEFLLLLTAGWDQVNLRPRQLAAKRIGVINGSDDPQLAMALRIAAHAASVELFDLDPTFADRPAEAAASLGGLLDAVAIADAEGVYEAWYEQDAVSVINLGGPSGAPLDALGQLHTRLRHGGGISGTRVGWRGDLGPALTSWVELTGDMRIHVTQVGGTTTVTEKFLARLRDEGQAGSFERVETADGPFDVDANITLDLRTRACVIAAAFEFWPHRH